MRYKIVLSQFNVFLPDKCFPSLLAICLELGKNLFSLCNFVFEIQSRPCYSVFIGNMKLQLK